MKTDFIPSIIDIEASGFGSNSFPIEIGLVTQFGERYCSLIRPHEHWQYWDSRAESLHGISRQHLHSYGKDIRRVCEEFNALLEGMTVYSDAWSHDNPWLRRLYEYGGLECKFGLSAIEFIASEEQLSCWDEVKQSVIQRHGEKSRHRASNDALIVQQTFLESASLVQKKKSAGDL